MPKPAPSDKSSRGSNSSQLRRNIILASISAICIAAGLYFALRGESPDASGAAVTPAVTKTADELTQRLQQEKERSEYSRRATQEPEFTGEPGEGRRAHTVDPPR